MMPEIILNVDDKQVAGIVVNHRVELACCIPISHEVAVIFDTDNFRRSAQMTLCWPDHPTLKRIEITYHKE